MNRFCLLPGKNTFDRSYLIGNQLIQIKLTGFVPNPAIVLQDDIEGQPTIKLVVTSGEGREEYYLQNGETKLIHEVKFNFSNQFDQTPSIWSTKTII